MPRRIPFQQGIQVAGIFKNYDVVKQWVQMGDSVSPDPENHATYRRLYAIPFGPGVTPTPP